MDGTKLPELPALGLAPGVKKENINPEKVVVAWLEKLDKWFQSRQDLASLFIDNCWWRDILGFDWDFTTKRGVDDIGKYLEGRSITNLQASIGGLKPILLDMGGMVWIQSGFTFKNEHGNGTGFVRLGNVSEGEWRAWIVFTQLEELSRQKEIEAVRNRSHAAAARASHVNGVAHEPQVLIVGAGQAGVSLAARLGSMGVRTLLVDRHGRIGDSWRARYESCTLNTPTFTDHYPFLKYPENWPRWLSRDQVADFMEHYAQLMGLNLRLKTSVTFVKRDEAADRFTVELKGPEGHQTLTPRHVVLATGVFSDEPIMPDIPGMDNFAGLLYHSAKHRTARDVPDVTSKRVVVIGPGTSGHDVAQDFVEHGAKSVTLVQRNPIFSMSAEAWETIQLGLWSMPGLTTEEADVVGNSLPLAVIRTMSIGLTRALAEFDKDMVAGLRAAGLALRTGEDGYGLADHQLIEGGRYYIDQGANDMIIDGRIKVLQCDGGVARLDAGGIELADGRRAEADVVVFATGYRHNITMVRRLMGDDVADAMPRFGLLDDEQERAGWWRPTGVRGFWYMTGSFMYCRQFSQALALQIAA
ncbi:flavin-containing monooxygenase, partial [Plectosphaerella cucumerina]